MGFLERDQSAGELKQREVVLGFLRPADQQGAVAVEPGVAGLDDPTPRSPSRPGSFELKLVPRSEGTTMARKTIFVSDLTGKTIDENDAAIVTIRYSDASKGQVVLDVNSDEVADLAAKGTKQARRGRKPKS
jgi:hypothetical protein